MDIDAVRRSYRRWAPVYDRTFGAATNPGRRRAAAYLSKRGGSLLEVGVGTGLVLPLYGGDLAVTGVDYSEEMLAKAEEKVRDQGLTRIKALRQMDARQLDFPDASFDSVAAMHVLSVVPEPERVLSEMARVCKPGGKVVIVNHFSGNGGLLGLLEKLSARLENVIGWQSDFAIEHVLGEPRLVELERDRLPPIGMMTWLLLERKG
ncbi:class I SAM-dependent methyltransferase [Acidimangrovimonas pyrenivorans]|uniref:Class I SAM-dependent methyltransferase n=1 Tax=Acidimangrovimonas pyrenivorans TaxID=2030798 RepID=A0ABV7AGD2_9RHOB